MAQTENAMLILQAGGNEAGRRWPLGRKRIVIGRDIDCDIVLPDRLVSRHHAQIVWDTERLGYLLQDLYSKNGTFVNGLELAEPTVLQDGDAVSYTHLRAHETVLDIVCRLLLEKKKH